MINWLQIKNLALVDNLEIDFGSKLNIVTGETGAGKSIIMSAIALILGGRADKNSIRTGEKSCEIVSSFSIPKNLLKEISDILETVGCAFEDDSNELIIKRIFTLKTSKIYLNDKIITLSTLKNLGDLLVDMHGANEHQSLIKESVQLNFLDKYAKTNQEILDYNKLFQELKDIQKEKSEFLANIPNPVELDHFKFIISEIDKVAPQKNEDDELIAKHKIIANSKQIAEIIMHSSQIIEENDSSIIDNLRTLFCNVQELSKFDDKFKKIEELLNITIESVQEISYDIARYADDLELDESAFNELEERLSAIQTIKRRYGPTLEQVFATYADAELRIVQFENSQDMKISLDAKEKSAQIAIEKTAVILSKKRKKMAILFEKDVVNELHKLGFLKSDFKISFKKSELGKLGYDKIDYLFSPNPGEELRLLKKIASSGEISRVMLALKTILAESDTIPILIFDEIDANIGGETASIVGSELKQLAKNHQILCISHLPQVASKGDVHFLVQKEVIDNKTYTKMIELDKKQKQQEISRMLGGGSAAFAHAADLVKKGEL